MSRTEQFARTIAKNPPPASDGGDEFSAARPIPCTYPGCGFTSRHRLGRKIHATLVGHALPADKLAKGDGPVAEPRVHRGPRTLATSVLPLQVRLETQVLDTIRHRHFAADDQTIDPDAVGDAVDAIVAGVAQLLDALGGGDDSGAPTDGTSPEPATTMG